MSNDDSYEPFERRLVANLAGASLKEQRARRRWGIFFRFVFWGYVLFITGLWLMSDGDEDAALAGAGGSHAAVIDIQGIIAAGADSDSETVNAQLRAAFANDEARGVILRINSPGGSAVESHRIYKEILRLREKNPDKKVYAVAGDFCASGGYFVASAADAIYANEASLIGSIGVIFSGFGFVEAMRKLGVERRVVSAGNNKNMFDPFSPEDGQQTLVIRKILQDIHTLFIDSVKSGRGEKLASDDKIFSGAIFSGTESARLGLVDGHNDAGGVARDVIGVERLVYYGERGLLRDIFDELGVVAARLGFGGGALRAQWLGQ